MKDATVRRRITAPNVVHGEGSAEAALAAALPADGQGNVLFVTPAAVARTSALERLIRVIPTSSLIGEADDRTPLESVERTWRYAQDHGPITAVVAVGGGSSCDTAKLVALALGTGRAPRVLFGAGATEPTPQDRVLSIMVPTTPTAAGFTGDASALLDGRRQIASGAAIVPDLVILDSTVAPAPLASFVTSAFPAVTHCADALLLAPGNPFASCLASEALEGMLSSLAVLARTDAGDARQAALESVWLAASALAVAGVGVPHALCQVVGALTGASHGQVHAVVLPNLLEDAQGAPPWLGRTSDLLDRARVTVAQARDQLGMPRGLRQLGVTRPMLAQIAEETATHPKVRARFGAEAPSPDDLRATLDRAWDPVGTAAGAHAHYRPAIDRRVDEPA